MISSPSQKEKKKMNLFLMISYIKYFSVDTVNKPNALEI